jgi:hypothetical protein
MKKEKRLNGPGLRFSAHQKIPSARPNLSFLHRAPTGGPPCQSHRTRPCADPLHSCVDRCDRRGQAHVSAISSRTRFSRSTSGRWTHCLETLGRISFRWCVGPLRQPSSLPHRNRRAGMLRPPRRPPEISAGAS